jgi:Zn-dependent peptidase ImmA (M78 family)
LIEAAAVPVFVVDLGHEKLSAISMPGVTGRHVIVLNGQLPASARRFALAHELGHLIMHNGVATDDMERDADAFASALLMPASDIRPALRAIKFRDLGALKPRWRVSLAALIRRAHDLQQISDRQYKTFNIELNKLGGGRKREPAEFEPERPRLMRHVLDHFQEELDYSTAELAKLLVMTERSLHECYFGHTQGVLRAVGSANRKLNAVPMP